jgi:integrase
VFLQTGLRISELCDLRVSDLDFTAKTLTIQQGKGRKARVIHLESRGIQARRLWLKLRGEAEVPDGRDRFDPVAHALHGSPTGPAQQVAPSPPPPGLHFPGEITDP